MRLDKLAGSWRLDLRVQRKSDRTVEACLLAARQLCEFLEDVNVHQITANAFRDGNTQEAPAERCGRYGEAATQVRKGKHTPTRTTSIPFQERASIWLAKRHLTSDYHRVPKDQLTGSGWHSLARRHDHMHLADEGGAIRHCGWTPAVARPVLPLILFYSLLTIIGPVGWVPPVGLFAVLTGWLVTGSVVTGLVWALTGSLLVFVVLVVYWSVESIRLMLIPPSPRRLDVWQARYVNWESYDDGYDGGWGPFTFLWPGRTGEWG